MSTIKINELATTEISLTDFIAKADSNGLMTKNTIQGLGTFLETVGSVSFRGSLSITDTPTLDGWYFATESGTYTNAGSLIVNITNQLVIIVVSDTQTTFSKIDIPLSITFDNTPTNGSSNAVESGGVFTFVNDKFTIIQGTNLALEFIDDTLVNASGVLEVYPSTNWKVAKCTGFTDADVLSFGNFNIDNQGRYSWYLDSTPLGLGGVYNTDANLPIENITPIATANTLYFLVSRDDSVLSDYENTMCNIGATLLPYEAPYEVVENIESLNISANRLSLGNTVPTPTTDGNAVNKKFLEDNYTNTTDLSSDFVSQTEFDTNGIKVSDLTIDISENLAKLSSILDDTFVANVTGLLTTASGFKTMIISNLTEGQIVSFGNFEISNNGNYSWYNDDTLVSFGGSYANTSVLPIENITVPIGVNKLCFLVFRDGSVESDYENTMCNIGATLLPYEAPIDYVTAIKDYEIAGSVGDVALQDTDVTFTSVTANALNLDLPSGATEPVGLEIGDAWVDTNDSSIKVKLS